MKTFKYLIFYLISLMIMLTTAACAAGFGAPTATPQPTLPPTATATDMPTHTPVPTDAPTATPAPTATIPLTPTPDVGTDFSQAKVTLHGKTETWNYFFTLSLPGQPKGNFYALVDKNKNYTCTLSAKVPTRMTCIGQMTAFDDYVDFVLYANGVDAPLFTTRVFIPPDLTQY
jgi:hypothetical protein